MGCITRRPSWGSPHVAGVAGSRSAPSLAAFGSEASRWTKALELPSVSRMPSGVWFCSGPDSQCSRLAKSMDPWQEIRCVAGGHSEVQRQAGDPQDNLNPVWDTNHLISEIAMNLRQFNFTSKAVKVICFRELHAAPLLPGRQSFRHTYVRVCVYIYVCIHIYVCVHVYACTCVYIYAHSFGR